MQGEFPDSTRGRWGMHGSPSFGGAFNIQKSLYIAETNENGSVVFVWVNRRGHKAVRPFQPGRHGFQFDRDAEYSGAESRAIQAWMTEHLLPERSDRPYVERSRLDTKASERS